MWKAELFASDLSGWRGEMAHRKPIGSTFESVFDWEGDPPEPEDYLMSQAGTWYRVLGVIEKKNPAKVGLMLERIEEPETVLTLSGGRGPRVVQDVDGAFRWVHEFWWYPRSRSRQAA